MRYRVEILFTEDEEGNRAWTLAARRGPKMDNGAAIDIDADEAIALLNVLEAEGAPARIVPHED